jgi:hypothetical protein
MLALIASGLLVAYILIPGALYRTIFSLFNIPLKTFQRTRADEIRYAVLVGLVPLALTCLLVYGARWPAVHPFAFPEDSVLQRRADYRLVFGAAYSERLFERDPAQFWHALNHVLRRQGRLLSWYYLFLVIEAIGLGFCSTKLWWFSREFKTSTTRRGRVGTWCCRQFADHVVAPQISEWYFLLSTAAFAPGVPRRVQLDVLLDGDMLYRGTVEPGAYFMNKDGTLSGVLLTNASRFDRRRYLSDEADKKSPRPPDYWKAIPGAKLYLPYDKVSNFNIRYEPTQADLLKRIIEKLMPKRGIKFTVTPKEPEVKLGS